MLCPLQTSTVTKSGECNVTSSLLPFPSWVKKPSGSEDPGAHQAAADSELPSTLLLNVLPAKGMAAEIILLPPQLSGSESPKQPHPQGFKSPDLSV